MMVFSLISADILDMTLRKVHVIILLSRILLIEVGMIFNRIKGKYMLKNKKLLDRERRYQFLRRIPI